MNISSRNAFSWCAIFLVLLSTTFMGCRTVKKVLHPYGHGGGSSHKAPPGPHEVKGIASWYGGKFHGRLTANGERYNKNGISAAHKTLPFGTVVRVKNLRNGKTVDVRINDRGPFIKGRIIDLSKGAAKKINMINDGIVPVELTILKMGNG